MDRINPIRIDVVIFTVNKAEAFSTLVKFGLNKIGKEKDFEYRWGVVEGESDNERIYVAHVSFDDKSGIQQAILTATKICDTLYPSYILILGIAGGRRGDKDSEESIKLGDLIVSKIVKHGPISNDHLRENPVLQPDTGLFHAASELDKNDTWRGLIAEESRGQRIDSWKSLIAKNPPGNAKSTVYFEELVSTDQIIDDLKNNPKLDEVLKKFPRMVAADMEAGAVAGLLLDRYSAGKWTPRFFVIKGISDLIDAEDSEKQESTRHLWREYAADAAASFARALIQSFTKKIPTCAMRLLPAHMENHRPNTDCSGILYSIQPEHYSAIAEHILDKIVTSKDFGGCLFFTVCAYDPIMLYEMTRKRFIYEKNNEPKTNKRLKDWTLDHFGHFRTFGNVAREYYDKCFRILLLDGSTEEEDEENNWAKKLEPHYWELFTEVNRGVRCWGIGRRDLESVKKEGLFLTDYVIIGDRILLDYYDESHTLIMSDLNDPVIKSQLLGLRDLFFRKMGDGNLVPFKELPLLESEAKRVFEKRGYV
ncbi:MAG: hypothetical protein AB1552_10965 [Nitrospirota bacterium]